MLVSTSLVECKSQEQGRKSLGKMARWDPTLKCSLVGSRSHHQTSLHNSKTFPARIWVPKHQAAQSASSPQARSCNSLCPQISHWRFSPPERHTHAPGRRPPPTPTLTLQAELPKGKTAPGDAVTWGHGLVTPEQASPPPRARPGSAGRLTVPPGSAAPQPGLAAPAAGTERSTRSPLPTSN